MSIRAQLRSGHEQGRRVHGELALGLSAYGARVLRAARRVAGGARRPPWGRIVAGLALPDLYLVAACERRIDGATEALDRRYRPRMMAGLRAAGCPMSEAEELVQDLFGELYCPPARGLMETRLSTYEGRAPLAVWLGAILRHRMIDRERRLRRSAREPLSRALDAPASPGVDPARSAQLAELARELGRRLAAGFERLTARERSALELWALDGLAQREVAARLGVGEPRASRLLSRARGRLLDALGRHWCAEAARAAGGSVAGLAMAGVDLVALLPGSCDPSRSRPPVRARRSPPLRLRRGARAGAMGRVGGNFLARLHPLRRPSSTTAVSPATLHVQDHELVRDVLDGTPAAREVFCERMRCIARILAARNARAARPLSEHDLADVAQEVALAVWRRLPSYTGEAALETWVYSFCSLTWMSAWRRRNGQPPAWSDLGEEGPPEPASIELDSGPIDRYLKHLSARESEVLRLRHVDGLGNGEIAQALSISVNSVKTHSANGMRKLREVFGHDEGGPR